MARTLPRILITNDDGIDAPGLRILAEIAHTLSHDVWIVAPEKDRSGTSSSLSIRDAVTATAHGEKRWAVSGTPGDCIALALGHLMADSKPSLVLSGINAGENVGDEVNLSGTVGAAMTALMLGVPSIAISQMFTGSREQTPWNTSRTLVPEVLRHLLTEGWPDNTCLSVNIPDAPPESVHELQWTRQASKNVTHVHYDTQADPHGVTQFWLRLDDSEPLDLTNTDYAILRQKKVTVLALALNRCVDLGRKPLRFLKPEPDNV